MEHLNNSEVLIKSDEKFPNTLALIVKVETLKETDFINAFNLVFELAPKYGYQHLYADLRILKDSINDSDMNVKARMKWYDEKNEKMANAGIKSYTNILRPPTDDDYMSVVAKVMVRNLTSFDKLYLWLSDLNRPAESSRKFPARKPMQA